MASAGPRVLWANLAAEDSEDVGGIFSGGVQPPFGVEGEGVAAVVGETEQGGKLPQFSPDIEAGEGTYEEGTTEEAWLCLATCLSVMEAAIGGLYKAGLNVHSGEGLQAGLAWAQQLRVWNARLFARQQSVAVQRLGIGTAQASAALCEGMPMGHGNEGIAAGNKHPFVRGEPVRARISRHDVGVQCELLGGGDDGSVIDQCGDHAA